MNKKKILLIAIVLLYGMAAVSLYQGKPDSPEKQEGGIFPGSSINHVTYYEKEDGSIEKYENGKKAGSIVSRYMLVEESKENDLYIKVLYMELEDGYRYNFPGMEIKGIKYSEEEREGKSYVDGYSYSLSDGEGNEKYAVFLLCSEEFNMEDVSLPVYDENDADFKETSCDLIKADKNKVNLCQTYNSTTYLVEVAGHYYLWDQSVGAEYMECGKKHEKVALTEKSILWMDKGASAKKLFNAIAKNYMWANEPMGETFQSGKASLAVKKVNGKYCLVKTARVDTDDATANPCYVTYKGKGQDGIIYLAII